MGDVFGLQKEAAAAAAAERNGDAHTERDLSDELKAQVRNEIAQLKLKDGAFANVAMGRVDAMDPFVGLECQPEPEAA